jgi:hypothetical protein
VRRRTQVWAEALLALVTILALLLGATVLTGALLDWYFR